MHLPDQDLARFDSIEAALSGRRKASRVSRVEQAFRFKAQLAAGTQPVLAGKPAVLVTVRGGSYQPGTPREGWDHATGWMRRVLADVWHLDLEVVAAEFTNVGVNPALMRSHHYSFGKSIS